MQFQGYIIHKTLIHKLLNDSAAYHCFLQKVSHHDAAVDQEEGGGIDLMNDDGARDIAFEAIKPETTDAPRPPETQQLWPLLPSEARNTQAGHAVNLAATLSNMSLQRDPESIATTDTPDARTSTRIEKAWGTGESSKALFPNAKPTLATSEWAIQHRDYQRNSEQDNNIMTTRFWDPTSSDWNPERFLIASINQYVCPFPCE